MPYEVKQKGNQFYVVDTSNNRIKGTYADEDDAEERKDVLDHREFVKNRLDRMPVTEMTPEEKAAAYDKMMAEKNNPTGGNGDPNIPPKQDPQTDPKNKPKKSAYWGDQLGE